MEYQVFAPAQNQISPRPGPVVRKLVAYSPLNNGSLKI